MMGDRAPRGGVALWTVDEAAGWFAEQGMPVDAWRLRLHIRALGWAEAGETRSGSNGGRGRKLYPAADLMRLHHAHLNLAGAPELTGPGDT